MTSPGGPSLYDDLRAVFPDVDVVLIGGGALAWWGVIDRKTDDQDLVVPLGREEVVARLQRDGPRWRRDAKHEHRWVHLDGAVVDVLPCGPAELATGALYWPESGHTMNMAGFRHVTARAVASEAGGHLVADKPTLALLKMVSWLDRPELRSRDLGDLAHLLCRYLGLEDDRNYSGEAATHGLYAEDAAAWWLGRDLSGLCDGQERERVREFIRRGLDPTGPQVLLARMAASGPAAWGRDEDVAHRALVILEAGFHGRAPDLR